MICVHGILILKLKQYALKTKKAFINFCKHVLLLKFHCYQIYTIKTYNKYIYGKLLRFLRFSADDQ